MLHEILLSLSGQQSELFGFQTEENTISEESFPLLSPPEKALLSSLARLSRLHAKLRAHTTLISSSHPSVICRAVSTAIHSHHLGAFQKKILEVEKAILVEDSGYVGGYGIVPLATIVGEFSPWTRRLEWLWDIGRFIQPTSKESTQSCTGASLIDHLRGEAQTGYVDLEEIALHLISAAETAWMRQLSTWLLYGNLPILGKSDFFIQEGDIPDGERTASVSQFAIHTSLLPQFVSPHTASSILFIGKTLNLIRAKRSSSTGHSSDGLLLTSPVTLHGEHINHLAGLKSPISASMLSNAIDSIRFSLSQSTLSKLLPLHKILEILSLLHDFLLLRRGEFATALISHADARLQERQRRSETLTSRNLASDGLDGLAIKEGDVATALTNAWAELYSLQNEEDPVDDELDLARDLLRLSIKTKGRGQALGLAANGAGVELETETSDVPFDDLLFPAPTSLLVQVHPPLDLFLSASDISVYSKIHSYLLSIRRAQIRLGDLWKHTSLRRSHPSPWGPPRSNSAFGQDKLRMGRQRDNARVQKMRLVWATGSASLFMLSEIGSFLQGEVINGSWQHFREWIEAGVSDISSISGSRPGTATSSKRGRPLGQPVETDDKSEDLFPSQRRHDPETLTAAHRRYLFALVQSLFLADTHFTQALRALLTRVDHFTALVIRLESIQRNMDLETDEGVVDALVDYASEEREVWQALRAAREKVETGIKEVVARLRDIDDSRAEEGRKMFDLAKANGHGHWSTASANSWPYVPRKAAGVDRLLMKLDFGTATG